jgi:hypothetical protein
MNQKIFYVTYQTPTSDQNIIERVSLAQKSIDRENELYKNWILLRDLTLSRDASVIGDVPVPFIKDMIEAGMEAAEVNDIVVISNADIVVVTGITEKIIELCNKGGSLYSHRYDFDVLTETPKTENDFVGKEKYLGCDLFAFTKKWWAENKHIFPDMVLGRQAWDMIFRRAVMENGGYELQNATYHKTHTSPWNTISNLAGNNYNLNLAYRWLHKYGGSLYGK